MRVIQRMVWVFVFWFCSVTTSFALDPIFSDYLGRAINGYDPVAYFYQGEPVKGSAEHGYIWKGAKWYFSSSENLNEFIAYPEKFAPQYGGYCAWAVSQNYTASIDPTAWNIEDGKLYLNFSKSVQKTWLRDVTGNINKADKNWPKLLNKD